MDLKYNIPPIQTCPHRYPGEAENGRRGDKAAKLSGSVSFFLSLSFKFT